jgi:hypothetical protein
MMRDLPGMWNLTRTEAKHKMTGDIVVRRHQEACMLTTVDETSMKLEREDDLMKAGCKKS